MHMTGSGPVATGTGPSEGAPPIEGEQEGSAHILAHLDPSRRPTAASAQATVSFVALFVVALVMAVILAALEGMGSFWLDPEGWLSGLDPMSALDTLSNAAEVVAGVLAIAITVVAIVVQLAATRYTHRITSMFVREPVNVSVISFFVLTTIQCVWVSA